MQEYVEKMLLHSPLSSHSAGLYHNTSVCPLLPSIASEHFEVGFLFSSAQTLCLTQKGVQEEVCWMDPVNEERLLGECQVLAACLTRAFPHGISKTPYAHLLSTDYKGFTYIHHLGRKADFKL